MVVLGGVTFSCNRGTPVLGPTSAHPEAGPRLPSLAPRSGRARLGTSLPVLTWARPRPSSRPHTCPTSEARRGSPRALKPAGQVPRRAHPCPEAGPSLPRGGLIIARGGRVSEQGRSRPQTGLS
ncbi:hypothetical protein T484DRAFT_2259403 [Baffinella frigidus]|nr:hypothetical protein T484DRAFT_2259403 [Cryptophyta sp. CCMP2293]